MGCEPDSKYSLPQRQLLISLETFSILGVTAHPKNFDGSKIELARGAQGHRPPNTRLIPLL